MSSQLNFSSIPLELLQRATRHSGRLQASGFELYFHRRTATKIDSKNQKVDSLSRSEDIGMSVRVIQDSRLGFSFTTSLEPIAIERAIQSASDMARVMPQDFNLALPSFENRNFSETQTDWPRYDETGSKTSAARKVEIAQELEAACRAADSRIQGVRSASFTESASETWLVDSQGRILYDRDTLFTSRVSCKAEAGGDSQMGTDFDFSHRLDQLDHLQVGRRAAQRAIELLQSKAAPTLICPAVLRNNVMADLIGFLSSSFSAEEVSKGRSLLAGKEGQRIFAPGITILDDGILTGGIASCLFDGEGTPSRQNQLVDNGTLQGYLYDLYHARKNGKEPTGNAARSIKSLPGISTNNLYMNAGSEAPEALIQGISRGILITDLMGLHTANSVTGDFSLGASGILIENGILTQPVRGFAVAGNILELFRRVTDIGNDLRFYGSVGAPSVRISSLSVGGQ